MERDPFILTGLMWSWLEQLKEPVVSLQEALALDAGNADAHAVLGTLDKVDILICSDANQGKQQHEMLCLLFQAQRETITCILDCMAHLLRVPEEVENAFLNRTIKAFTWVRSENAFSGISSNDSRFLASLLPA